MYRIFHHLPGIPYKFFLAIFSIYSWFFPYYSVCTFVVLAVGKWSQRNTLLSIFKRNNSGQLTEIPEDSKTTECMEEWPKSWWSHGQYRTSPRQFREEFKTRLLKSRRTIDCRFDLNTFSGSLKRSKNTNSTDFQDFSQTWMNTCQKVPGNISLEKRTTVFSCRK